MALSRVVFAVLKMGFRGTGEQGEAVDLKPELLKKPVSAAPYVNPALKTVAQKPGYIPPNQLQLTTNVKVGAAA